MSFQMVFTVRSVRADMRFCNWGNVFSWIILVTEAILFLSAFLSSNWTCLYLSHLELNWAYLVQLELLCKFPKQGRALPVLEFIELLAYIFQCLCSVKTRIYLTDTVMKVSVGCPQAFGAGGRVLPIHSSIALRPFQWDLSKDIRA